MTRLLALDLGTTSFKAVVYDQNGGKLHEQRADPPDRRIDLDGVPVDLWEAEELWLTVADLCKRAVEPFAGAVDALAIAQLGLIGVPLNADDEPLFPFVTWLDPAAGTAKILTRSGLTDTALFAIAGNRLNSIYPPAWIGWMSEHERRFADGMHRWVFVGDWLAYRLSGVLTTDYSITSQTLTLDQRELRLREDLLDAFALPHELFLPPRQAGTTIGEVTAEAARATGIAVGVTVVLGGADWMIGVLGSGLTEPGDVGILTGTWELTAACLRAPCLTAIACESGTICDPHVAPGRWALRIEALSGGVTEWLREQLEATGGAPADWDEIVAACAAVPPGSGGVVFVPHLFGSYGPRHDELARGAFVGLTGSTTRAAMGRAVFEGLSYQTRAAADALTRATGVEAGRVVVMGGGVKNGLWLQTRADALGRGLEVVEDPDVTPRGAAMLAGLGIGLFSDYHDAVARFAPRTVAIEPEPRRAALYEKMYHSVYVPVQDSLEAVNHRLAVS
ncbi:MAG TPA: FGGY family carbohydrate kinase [Solirubrobacteraceae bacterium]